MLTVAKPLQERRINRCAADVSIAASTYAAAFTTQVPAKEAQAKKPRQRRSKTTKSAASPKSKAPPKSKTSRPGLKGNWARGQSVSKKSPKKQSPKKSYNKENTRRCPYSGPNPEKDRITGEAAKVYFAIREKCNKGNDNVDALRQLLPTRVCDGQDFAVWPRQHLLLHGLVKQGCVECVRYLLCDLKFNINQPRQKDGCVPLHICFYNPQSKALDTMADLLIQLGANQNATNKWGEPPCMFEYKAASLVEKGAFPTIEQKEDVSATKAAVEETQGSPNCVADFLSLDMNLDLDDGLSLGPPATPTPRKAKGIGKMFTSEKTLAEKNSAEIEAQVEAVRQLAEMVWLATSTYSVYNIAGQISCWKKASTPKSIPKDAWSGKTVSKPVFRSQQSGEMYDAVRTAVLA